MKTVAREKNRRGEGGRLRAEIVAGATELLEQAGTEEAVTLRAVARKVGISAPSIYSHFADRDAIIDAIVDDAFSDFNEAIYAASRPGADPLTRLKAGCTAYVRFAAERPNRYWLLFGRKDLVDDDGEPPAVRIESFLWLVQNVQDCVDAGISASTDPTLDSTAIWMALHGFATLHARLPGFPWPEDEAMIDRIVCGLARITAGPASGAGPA
jgi:AcrR family transcriptional regulator